MMRVAAMIFGMAVVVSSPLANTGDSFAPAVKGIWAPDDAGACGRPDERIVLDDPVRVRRITPTRWYIELETAAGLLALDINSISATRLLVAERPLGEARFFVRCGDA